MSWCDTGWSTAFDVATERPTPSRTSLPAVGSSCRTSTITRVAPSSTGNDSTELLPATSWKRLRIGSAAVCPQATAATSNERIAGSTGTRGEFLG